MIAVDTNLIVRYLTGDHPEQSLRARALIDSHAVYVAVTVVLEAEWVLRSTYGFTQIDVVRALRAFGGLPTVTMEDATRIAMALDLADHGLDFADALHLASSAHCVEFATFDRKLVKAGRSAGHSFVREA